MWMSLCVCMHVASTCSCLSESSKINPVHIWATLMFKTNKPVCSMVQESKHRLKTLNLRTLQLKLDKYPWFGAIVYEHICLCGTLSRFTISTHEASISLCDLHLYSAILTSEIQCSEAGAICCKDKATIAKPYISFFSSSALFIFLWVE